MLSEAILKVQRANEHILELQDAIRFLESKYTSTVERDQHTGVQELIHAAPNFGEDFRKLSLIIGDAVHNLHTALDYAWAATIEKQVPMSASTFTKFPVRETRALLEAALHGAAIDTGCPALFNTIVSAIQPYSGGNNDIIWTLHKLDISDKHLLLLELTPTVSIKNIIMVDKDGQISHGSGIPVQNSGPYVIAFEPGVQIKERGKLAIEITVKEAGIFKGVPVLDLLPTFSRYVAYVVQLLENL